MLWGLWSCLASLKRGRTAEHALGTVVLSCFSEKGEEGRTVERVLETAVLSGMGSLQCVPALVMSGMGSLQCVPALVMYPDCGPVCHGKSSVCASPSRHMC